MPVDEETVVLLEQAMTLVVYAVCRIRGIDTDRYAEEKNAEYIAERITRDG